jgi:hypothetical protein
MLLLMPVASWGEPTTIERHWARLIATLLQAIHLQQRGDQALGHGANELIHSRSTLSSSIRAR